MCSCLQNSWCSILWSIKKIPSSWWRRRTSVSQQDTKGIPISRTQSALKQKKWPLKQSHFILYKRDNGKALGRLPWLSWTKKSRRITPISHVPIKSLKSHVVNYVVSPWQQVSSMKSSNPWQSKFLHLRLRMTGYSLLVSDCQEECQPIPSIVLLNILTFAYQILKLFRPFFLKTKVLRQKWLKSLTCRSRGKATAQQIRAECRGQ